MRAKEIGYPNIDAITDGTIAGWDRARRARMVLACRLHLRDLRMAGHSPEKTELQIPHGAVNHIPARVSSSSSIGSPAAMCEDA